jgi:RsiW-degrading membrane proteinase PrsW (M82 family)
VFGRQGGRQSVSMGAAVNIKNYLTFSILTVFLLSFANLIFALILSWENKPNTIYFLVASFILAVLGSVLSTDKKISLTEVIKLLKYH